jgi:hypothetical protein
MVQPTGIRQCAKGDDGSLLGPQPMQFPRRLTDQVRSVTARTTLQAANVRHPLIPMHVNREGQRCNPLSACTHSRYFASPQRLHKLTFLGNLAVHAQVHLVVHPFCAVVRSAINCPPGSYNCATRSIGKC